jgi:SulP family sulfate permease
MRLDGELFFANATLLRREVLEAVRRCATPVRAVLIDLEATSELDLDSLDMLDELCSRLQGMGIELHLARVRDPVRDMFAREGGRIIADDHLHRTVEDGVRAILAALEAGPDPVRDAAPPAT